MAAPYEDYMSAYRTQTPVQFQPAPAPAPIPFGGGGGYQMQAGGSPFVAGGSGWAGQQIDLMRLAASQQQSGAQIGLAREELEFKRWAAEQGFEIDRLNLTWLKEQFYRQKEQERQMATGYLQGNPLETMPWVDPNAPVMANEMEARRFLYDKKGNARKFIDSDNPTDDQIFEGIGRYLESERIGQSALEVGSQKGWFRDATGSAGGPGQLGGAGQVGGAEGWQKTLERETAEWNRELQQQGLGLNYMQLLGSLKGPRDWMQYANVARAAEGSALPGFAQSLLGQQNIAQFQGTGDGGYQSIWNQPAQTAQAAMGQPGQPGMGPPAPFMGAPGLDPALTQPGMVPAVAAAAAPNWAQQIAQNPHGVRNDQWMNMMPAEQQMLAGAIENQGADFNDWAEQMRRSWVPRQQAVGQSSWNIR